MDRNARPNARRALGALILAVGLLCIPSGRGLADRPMTSVDTGMKSSISIFAGAPVFLDVDNEIVRPRAALDIRFGFDLGYITFDFDTGFQANRVRASRLDLDPPLSDDTLKRVHFGFGTRFQVPNDSNVLPYLSVNFDFNWWNLFEQQIICGGWVCGGHSKYRFTPGFTGRAGMAFDIGSGLLLDVGLGAGMSLTGSFFEEKVYWLEPYIGVTFRQ